MKYLKLLSSSLKTKVMKYFLYCRKSSEDKSRQIQSIEDQKKVLVQLATERGLSIADIVIDEKSAKKPGRKGFAEMMERIQSKEATGILCWKLDRLARNPVDGGSITWLLQQGLIQEIVTPDRTFRPSDNVLLIGIEFGMANQFIIDLRKSVKRGMGSKIDKGWLPTKAPLGYINEVGAQKGAKRILPDPKTFPLLQKLWKRLIKDKLKLAPLYEVMKDEFPLYRNGSLLHFSTFHRIFQNPFYAGLFTWQGQRHIGAHKAMITLQEYEEAQHILNTETQIRDSKLNFGLKGIFRCGVCEAQITAERHTKFNKGTQEYREYDYYKCPRHKRTVQCNESTVSEKILEKQILGFIEDLWIPDEIIEFGLEELERMRQVKTESAKTKVLKDEIVRVDKQIANAMRFIVSQEDSEIQNMTSSKLLDLKIEKKRREEELDLCEKEQKDPYADIRNSLELIKGARYAFLNGSPKMKRKVIDGLGSNWKLKDKKIEYKPYFTTSAIKRSKELLKGGNMEFELNQAQTDNKKLPLEAVSCIWSG